MRKNIIIWVLLLFFVILGIAVIDSGATRPIDWHKSYNIRDKIPYGTYVLHEELPQIMGADRTYSDFGRSFYEQVASLDTGRNYDAVLLEIHDYISIQDVELKKVLDYVTQGGELFLSTRYISDNIMDTLGFYMEELDYERFRPTDQRVHYTLGTDTTYLKIERQENFQIFSKLDPATTTVLGHLHARGRAIPNFVKIRLGKGQIYLHSVPEVFGNYHMLQEPTYDYASKVLSVVENKEVLFSDVYYSYEQPRTPLRVILSKPGLFQAWYILIAGLLALLLFKSKREQRAVKVIKPEPNLSKQFAETIGNMYYENGNPGNIIHKKIDYFLYVIRAQYHLDTMDVLDDRFVKQLSLKAGVDLADTRHLMQQLERYRKAKSHQLEDVKTVNNLIEEYKQKAKII